MTKISDLSAGAAVSGTDVLPNVQTAGVGPVKTTATQLQAFVLKAPYVAKTADYTLTSSDYCVKCTTNAFTITLPDANGTGIGAGKVFVIKNMNTAASVNNITVATTSSQLIDGYAGPGYISTGQSWTVMSDGANWMII